MKFLKEEEDLLLDREGREKLINNLKKVRFGDLKIHPHYWKFKNPKYGPRHNISLEEAKEVYNKFDKIIAITKRKSISRYKYCFVYKISKRTNYKLLFFLDEKPPQLFNAMKGGKNIEKRLKKKFFGFSG